jgi:hypothetical protein
LVPHFFSAPDGGAPDVSRADSALATGVTGIPPAPVSPVAAVVAAGGNCREGASVNVGGGPLIRFWRKMGVVRN